MEPGATVTLADASIWRIARKTTEQLVARVELERVLAPIAAAAADSGRAAPAPDQIVAPTVVAAFDLPDLGASRRDAVTLHVAACQPVAGWRPVPIEVAALDEVQTASSALEEAVIGTAASILGAGPATLFDRINSVEVELADDEHWLESRDEDALVNGANLAVLGSELIQFGSAVALGSRRYRLGRLLRGRRGTEWAMGSHAPGEPFVLLSPSALRPVELPLEAVGATVSVRPAGLADQETAAIEFVAGGEALRPPSPVSLRARWAADGTLQLSWIRRSRAGWAWLDGIEPPLGESAERYRVEIAGSAGSMTADTTAPEIAVGASEIAALGAGQAVVSVVQVGDYALSRPALLTVQPAD